MTLVAAGLAYAVLDQRNIFPELFVPHEALSFLPWSLPPLAASIPFYLFEEQVPDIKQIKENFDKELVPAMKRAGPIGLLVVAAGAGYGEEALFRGFIQPYVQMSVSPDLVESWGVDSESIAIGATALIFGSLHALNSLYFIWATLAGVLFGFEVRLLNFVADASDIEFN